MLNSSKTEFTLHPAIQAPTNDFHSSNGGRVQYYYVTELENTRPLVFIHSINAAPSSFEMQPLFERYRTKRQVFALDLPGFGCSERADRRYTPELFAATINDFLTQVVQQPADIIAFSLSCEFAARAAQLQTNLSLIKRLVFLSPTGFMVRKFSRSAKLLGIGFSYLFNKSNVTDVLFTLLTTRSSIRFFYRQAFVGPVPPELIEYAYATTHQPGAKYAPLAFLAGGLFTPQVAETLYHQLTQPVLVLYERDPHVDFQKLPDFLNNHLNWRAEKIAGTHGMPQWDKPAATCELIDEFWDNTAET